MWAVVDIATCQGTPGLKENDARKMRRAFIGIVITVLLLTVVLTWNFCPTAMQNLSRRLLPRPNNKADLVAKEIESDFLNIYHELNFTFKIKSLPECDKKPTVPCKVSSCNATIPEDPLEDLKIVLKKQEDFPHQYLDAIDHMSSKVLTKTDITFMTAASADHFDESQGLVKSLHQIVFPELRRSNRTYQLIYYDLGLTSEQRQRLESQCQCTVLDFPFQDFPEWMKRLKCYTWKPIVVYSHQHLSPVSFWMDASVRVQNTSFEPMISHVLQKGVATFPRNYNLATYTAEVMMEFYGDQHCRYAPYPHFEATMLGLRHSPWVRDCLLVSWVSCALSPRCMCPPGVWRTNTGLYLNGATGFGRAHRYDQASLDILLAKMFREHSYGFQPPELFLVRRGDRVKHFT